MEYLALYRKYRPDNFDDVVGQENIVKVIKNAIENNKISHAYLFSGPRGTGKTTIAKIIAKMVNCENLRDGNPCNNCDSCRNAFINNDVVEIDAASNNGVDEIRELKNKINLVPSMSKYKIYIIDEVHMLTIQAFNALLKTLEEPPKHAIFILATTEPHKIPLTISSRCQKFQFTKIQNEGIVKKLLQITKNEKIKIGEEILYEIARLSDGGLRDAINLLDQLIAYNPNEIVLEDVYKICSSISYKELSELLKNIYNEKIEKVIDFVDKISSEGKNVSKFIEELIIFLKDILIYKNINRTTYIKDKNEIIKELSDFYSDSNIYNIIMELNELLIKIKNTNYPDILLIATLLKIIKKDFSKQNVEEKDIIVEEINDIKEKNEEKIELKTENIEKQEKKESNEQIKQEELIVTQNIKEVRINNTFATASKTLLNELKGKYMEVTNYLLDDKNNVVAGLLNDTEIAVAGEKNLILMTKIQSIANRLNEMSKEVKKIFKNIYKKDFLIIALTEEEWLIEKDKYIKNLKENKKYIYIEETKEEKKVKKVTPVDKLVDLFGEELIEYK